MDDLTTTTVELVSAILDSADMDLIGRDHWYSRAQAALETAAAGSQSTAQAVTTMCRKLQVDALTAASAQTVTRIAPTLDAHWGEWVEKIAREAPYLIALTRVTRKTRTQKETIR